MPRVTSNDQKEDPVRQADLLSAFCTARGWRHEIIQDLGSDMNFRKKGLNRLLEMILRWEETGELLPARKCKGGAGALSP